ncbi:hypothetical protein QCA50_015675 [Cerrena zonata]|uniref:Uncharacterized protein n=1 Tax=Cerrena zonata TaxID=2478898 RepID=A0AAW0FUT6_9APHY
MVIINYEPLEHLPYIDEPITEQERHNVEQLLRLELANNENGGDSNGLHPLVNEVIPLPNPNRSTPSPLLMQEIERYEQEEDTDDEQEPDRRLSNDLKEDQHEQLTRKRQQIEDINVIRKKRQVVDFKPVNDYLNDRWKDGIKSVVDLGIESARMDMEIHH